MATCALRICLLGVIFSSLRDIFEDKAYHMMFSRDLQNGEQ